MLTLHQKQVVFTQLTAKLIFEAAAMGFETTFGEAWRTPEQAEWNAAHGTGVKNSLHCQRLAIDLCVFKKGQYLTDTKDYEALGEWWEKQSTTEFTCSWGGRFNDGNHFSIENEGIR